MLRRQDHVRNPGDSLATGSAVRIHFKSLWPVAFETTNRAKANNGRTLRNKRRPVPRLRSSVLYKPFRARSLFPFVRPISSPAKCRFGDFVVTTLTLREVLFPACLIPNLEVIHHAEQYSVSL